VVVIIWLFDLQLPMQSVPITTQVVSSNPTHDEVCSIQHYIIKFVSDLLQADLGSITFKCNRLHYNYFAIFMITLHYDYINFQM